MNDTASPRPARRTWLRRRQPRDEAPRRRFDLRRALFILPNAFTVSSIFCGFYSILRSTSGDGPQAFYEAGIALFFAAFFDAFDGRVARLTRTQSDFGVQIDSLADVISFGVAPAILVHEWALADLGPVGVLAAFVFCACGAIRLARFNVLAARGQGSSKYFVGLPIPGAASMVVALVIAQSVWIHESVEAKVPLAVLVVVLSYLMVSRVRFRTFKDFRPSVKNAPAVLGVLIALVICVWVFRAAVAFVILVGGYIALGLIEEVLFFRKRREQRAGEPAPSPSPAAP